MPTATWAQGRMPLARATALPRLLLAASAALGLTLIVTPSASAQRVIHDVNRTVGFAKTECTGHNAQDCIAVRSKLTTIPVDEPVLIRLSCPQSHPHVVGWDARHHEHISLRVVSVGQMKPGSSEAKPRTGDLRVAARNDAHRPGEVRIVAGCSTQPYQGHPFMHSRRSVPSKQPGMRR